MLRNLTRRIIELAGYDIRRRGQEGSSDGGQGIFWPSHVQFPQTFFEVDEQYNNLYDLAQRKTSSVDTDNPLRRQRHYTLQALLRCAALEAGDACEVGCWRGLSAYQIAHHIKAVPTDASLHIFDSFEGLSDFAPADTPRSGLPHDQELRSKFAAGLEIVQRNLREFDFILFYEGWVPARFGEVEDKRFSFVHVDVDLYQPTYETFKFFYPRLVPGGLMVFDDYGCIDFPGAKLAVDAYLKTIDKPFFVPLPSGQALLIKVTIP